MKDFSPTMLTVDEFLSESAPEGQTLSDRISHASPEDATGILRDIAHIKSAIERNLHVQRLSKRLNVPKGAILKDLKELTPKEEGRAEMEPKMNANFPGLVDLVTDEGGEVAYLIKEDDDLQVETLWEVDGKLYCPPEKVNLPFELPEAEAVMKWHKSDSDGQLFGDVIRYLKRFSYLTDEQWLIVACKAFLSYISDHPGIDYLPMILFYAVPERGKSRTGQAFIQIAYRGVHAVDLRETNLFRASQDLKATLFFDLMDLWKRAERNGAEDILLLRFQKGAKATRVLYPEKGPFKDTVYYDVYGPTIIATNEAVHKILDTRCIPIIMPNKPGNYENPSPDKAQELKERLTAWRARVMNQPLPEIDYISELSGRLWDISKPLLQVCKMVCPQSLDGLKQALFEISGQRLEDKKATLEGEIVTVLKKLSKDDVDEWEISTADVVLQLNEDRDLKYKLSSQRVGKRLKAMGIRRRISNGHSIITMRRNDLDMLLSEFLNDGSCTPGENSPNSPNSPEQEISALDVGEGNGESSENSPGTHPPEITDPLGFGEYGDSGESCGEVESDVWDRCSDCWLLPSQKKTCEVRKPCPRLEE